MSCDELLRALTDYSDGALGRELCGEIERHLASCPSCEEVRNDLLRLARLCRECEAPSLPREARERIERLLHARAGGRS